MKKNIYLILAISSVLFSITTYAKSKLTNANDVNFINYEAELEPDFFTKSISGKVNIKFSPKVSDLKQLVFSTNNIQIKSVKFLAKPIPFIEESGQLKISFKHPFKVNKHHSIVIEYAAKPIKGMKFYEDHLFTFYHTKNWLVSHSDIADKASLHLKIIHDKNLTTIGNGSLIARTFHNNNKVASQWVQKGDIPVYTFGFALGDFNKHEQIIHDKRISYYYRKNQRVVLTADSIKHAFKDVSDMLSFFENKAGFSLPQKSYSYVVVEGRMAQEASGFSLVGEKFVQTVLQNKHENWFIAHELAHEWWGNSITCSSFSHFWLNEGLVQFLVAAYKQHLFGNDAYNKEINIAISRVKSAVEQDRVSPVAFRHKINESEINRTMTYSKGALVFHMLREQLGEDTFWKALKSYSLQYKGLSVTTNDLQDVFERVSDQDLDTFFEKWVYGNDIPNISL